MADDLGGFWVHQVTVTPLLGTGAYGDVEGPAQTVAGFLDESTRMVRNGTGEETVSQSTFYTDADRYDVFPPGSGVLLPGDRSTTVIGRSRHDAPGLDLPDHLEVALQ